MSLRFSSDESSQIVSGGEGGCEKVELREIHSEKRKLVGKEKLKNFNWIEIREDLKTIMGTG